MIIYNKNYIAKVKRHISRSASKDIKSVCVVRKKKVTKENKRFLEDLGFKFQDAANHRSTMSGQLHREL